jgi:hypothetical protein
VDFTLGNPRELRRRLVRLVRSARNPESLAGEHEASAGIQNWVRTMVEVPDCDGGVDNDGLRPRLPTSQLGAGAEAEQALRHVAAGLRKSASATAATQARAKASPTRP